MPISLKELAEKLDSSVEALKIRLNELDFEYDIENEAVEDDLAELLEDEMGAKSDTESLVDKIEENLQREIVQKQRKKTAGRGASGKKVAKSNESLKVDKLEIGAVISLKELAEKTGINAAKLIGELMKNGVIANINQQLDFDTASLLAADFGVTLKKETEEASSQDIMAGNLESLIGEEEAEDLEERPAIITIMGHVDHGKTKLLDTIRNTDVVAGESGGITQHVAAYSVFKNGKKITFLDTPGHEAFTEMRARGAKVTDIAILVVAATEGVKPTTIEAINHAKDAGVPIIVAINKMDLPAANPDKVMGELVEYGLQPEEWGGDTVMVKISALKGEGVDKLLEMILLVAEVQDLKANPNRPAVGTVVETHLDTGLGRVATIIVNTGTLRVGDNIVIGSAYGKVKVMKDHNYNNIEAGTPSAPLLVAGLTGDPHTGDLLQVVKNEKAARERALEIATVRKDERLSKGGSIDELVAKIQAGELKILKIILKADTKGSIEAIKKTLDGIESDEVKASIIHSGVGAITETDVMMASAAGALLYGFHVKLPDNIAKSAERMRVEVKLYKIIYELVNDTKRILSGLLSPEIVINELGKADVRQIFLTKKKEMILGLKITNGKLVKKSTLRILRNGEVIGEGVLDTLRKVDKVVDEIKSGNECGIKFVGPIPVEVGDVLEAYTTEERERTLS